MDYVWRTGGRVKRRVMHIQRYTAIGKATWWSLCNRGPFNRGINAPFSLGRPICKDCLRKLEAQP